MLYIPRVNGKKNQNKKLPTKNLGDRVKTQMVTEVCETAMKGHFIHTPLLRSLLLKYNNKLSGHLYGKYS